jgi:ABC-type polysaccharide/polyol phosphate export permease
MLALTTLLVRIEVANSVRRSWLGPLWGTVGLAAATAVLGMFCLAALRPNLPAPAEYVPALAVGLVVWSFLAGVASQSCAMVIRWVPLLRHSKLPLLTLPLAVVARHAVMLVVNLGLLLVLLSVFLDPPPRLGEALAGVVVLILNAAWLAALLAVLSVRFRDIGQLVSAVFHIAFFLSPIVWTEHYLGRYSYLFEFNPLFYAIAIVRRPMLGGGSGAFVWLVMAGGLAVGALAAAAGYRYARRRLPYWL